MPGSDQHGFLFRVRMFRRPSFCTCVWSQQETCLKGMASFEFLPSRLFSRNTSRSSQTLPSFSLLKRNLISCLLLLLLLSHFSRSDSVRPHRQQPTRLLCPWDSPGKSTGVGCHCLLRISCLLSHKLGMPVPHSFFPCSSVAYGAHSFNKAERSQVALCPLETAEGRHGLLCL